MLTWNMCRVLNKLFQIILDREGVGIFTLRISMLGMEPFSMVNIKVTWDTGTVSAHTALISNATIAIQWSFRRSYTKPRFAFVAVILTACQCRTCANVIILDSTNLQKCDLKKKLYPHLKQICS